MSDILIVPGTEMHGSWLMANQNRGIRCTVYKHNPSVVMYQYDVIKKKSKYFHLFLGIKELNFGYKIVKLIDISDMCIAIFNFLLCNRFKKLFCAWMQLQQISLSRRKLDVGQFPQRALLFPVVTFSLVKSWFGQKIFPALRFGVTFQDVWRMVQR
jgi:hypothetical protein